jgi:hypothetical protein
VSRYADGDDRASVPVAEPRIYLEVKPGLFRGTVFAMVDTAAPWCIFEPRIGKLIRESFDEVSGSVSLSTRLGTFGGRLYRGPLVVPVLKASRSTSRRRSS